MNFGDPLTIGVAGIVLVLVVSTIGIYMYFFRLWFRTYLSGAPVRVTALVSMPFRGIPPLRMVNHYVKARHAELGIEVEDLDSLYRTQGRVDDILETMIAAKKAGQDVSLSKATAMALD